jgi:biopolymer transport protein ExbB/TolQ
MRAFGWRIVLYFALVFMAGVGVGGLGTRYYFGAQGKQGGAERFRAQVVADMTRRLQLSPSQVQQLQAIFDNTRKEFGDFRDRHRDETHAIFDRQNERIMAMLNPWQQAEFKRMQAERHAHDKPHK